MNQVIGLFATPVMRIEKLLDAELVDALLAQINASDTTSNTKSAGLSHTEIVGPGSSPLFTEVSHLLEPALADFGALLFGQQLTWSIKEMWQNVLHAGGQQAMHNHANCFISGVLYLTPSHPSANTVFMKGPGGRDFSFKNSSSETVSGPFNADRWVAPDPAPGDLLLFPSYLLHEVPPNQGGQRITLAFNAIPTRLDSWGYAIGFSK